MNCPGHSTTAYTKGADGKPLWDSGLHRADGFPFSFRFDAPGTYACFCVVHGCENPNNPLTAMNGEVVVQPAAAAASAPPPARPESDVRGETVERRETQGSLAATGWTAPAGPALALIVLAVFARIARGRLDPA